MTKGTQHILQLPGGPQASTAISAPLIPIYCKQQDIQYFGTGAFGAAEIDLTFTITARSTINIQIVWGISSAYHASWFVTTGNGNTGTSIASPNPAGQVFGSMSMTTAITRDPGIITVQAFITNMEAGSGNVMIVAIVGSDTGSDCVVYANIL